MPKKLEIMKLKLTSILEECDKHVSRMTYATGKMSGFMPLSVKKFNSLSDEEIGHIDQFVFRFSKLQDSMGKRLFPLILMSMGEDLEDMSFTDILNKLEKLKIINNAESWKELREIRNEISHEYSSEISYLVEGMNKLYQNASSIIKVYAGIKKYVKEKSEL